MKSTIVLFINMLNYIDCSRLLVVFPLPGRSHSILGEGFVRHLLNAGHEITYVTPFPIKNATERLHQIDVSSNFDLYPRDQLMDMKNLMSRKVDMTDMRVILQLMFNLTEGTVMHKDIQRLIHDPKQHFDAVIAQWLFSEIYVGLSSVFNCPFIWFSSLEPHSSVISLIDGILNPAYVPDIIMSSAVPPLTFYQRAKELWNIIHLKYEKWLISDIETYTYVKAFSTATLKRGRELPAFETSTYNTSLMFGNSHVALGKALSLPPNYISIAGFHINEDIEPLPQKIQKIMDHAKHGVIFFSMGSLLRSKTMPQKLKRNLLDMFSGLNQTVIWKLEENLPRLPKNVHTVNWAPQQSILAHPNCILFITHGGLLSTTEALHFKVPIIGIPMSADQFNNVNRAVQKGFAKRIELNDDTPVNLMFAIEDILQNPSYRKSLDHFSFVYHHRPISPGKELVHWVEHVVETRGALHLRSPALMIPWYQKIYLDAIIVFIITFYFVRIYFNYYLIIIPQRLSKYIL